MSGTHNLLDNYLAMLLVAFSHANLFEVISPPPFPLLSPSSFFPSPLLVRSRHSFYIFLVKWNGKLQYASIVTTCRFIIIETANFSFY